MTRTMLFGDDGSVGADVAWLWVNSHCWAGWQVDVLHAEMPDLIRFGDPEPVPRAWQPPQPRAAFTGTSFEGVHNLFIDQDPRLALTRHADLVVIGTRGRGALKSMHLGSTAEWLMSRPVAPMVIARHGRPTKRVMLCVDGSPSADLALTTLADMPWIAGAEIHVVVVDDGRTEAEDVVGAAAMELERRGIRTLRVVLRGDVTDELMEYSTAVDFDLIALGTRGLTGVKRYVAGSTATKVSHSTDTSVLLTCAAVDQPSEATDDTRSGMSARIG